MATATVSSGNANRREDVFRSIFPPTDFPTPTPESTPNIGVIASPGRPFGGFNIPTGPLHDVVKVEQAWSTSTRYLVAALDNQYPPQDERNRAEVQEAIAYICSKLQKRKELIAWFSNEISIRFRGQVLPQLRRWHQQVPANHALELMTQTVAILQSAQSQYLGIIEALKDGHKTFARNDVEIKEFAARVKEQLHTQFLSSLPTERLRKVLFTIFLQRMQSSLEKHGDPRNCSTSDKCTCTIDVELPLTAMADVGIYGAEPTRLFVAALIECVEMIVRTRPCFAVDWARRTTVIPRLRRWAETQLAPAMERCMLIAEGKDLRKSSISFTNLLSDIVVRKLGEARAESLFDYVKMWPNSEGAVLDVRELILQVPSEKMSICHNFTAQTRQRLLHAGASTAEILSIYISVIHAFRLLDARGVLLEKVSAPIRAYLRSREDTVGIIAASFLAEADENGKISSPDPLKVCTEITLHVANSALENARDHQMLSLDDMSWTPDPIDAGPDYKGSKSEDILDYVLSLFDPEDFIKEITKVLAQCLLESTDLEFIKETKLIELLKSRKLDFVKLQAAEVMLKDVRDSVNLNRRINPHARQRLAGPPQPKEIQAAIPHEGISLPSLYLIFERRMSAAEFQAALRLVATRRGELYFPKRVLRSQEAADLVAPSPAVDVEYRVQVVSSFFWPQMRSNNFNLPTVLAELDDSFNQHFSQLGNQRKLHFRRAVARVTVDLQLEDRNVHEEDVPAWRATVIDAFASERGNIEADDISYNPADGLSFDLLVESAQMEEDLVRDALRFWIGKQVLYEKAPGVYAVLERLDMDTISAQQLPLPDNTVSAMISQDAMLRDNAAMFEAFIMNMLQNGGPKEVAGFMGITNTMKMVLPAFSYGDDEVVWLLREMEKKGQVSRSGEVWSICR